MRKSQLFRGIVVALLSAKASGLRAADAVPPSTNDVTRLPTITVTAEKEPAPVDLVPVSVTPVTREIIRDSGVQTQQDASVYSPSTYFSTFAPRKNSLPRFRGIGGLPIAPGVTSYIDGVPHLNSNSANQELVNVDQVEFIRGAQSALYGRNTIGGVINTTSVRPSNEWTGGGEAQYGNYDFFDLRGNVSGPVVKDELSFSLAGGYSERDGYTDNIRTGNDIDYRSGYFGKGQLLYSPAPNWDLRLIVSGQSDRDGDYPFTELNQLRANPHQASPFFEGTADRDIFSPTLQLHHNGNVEFTSTTGGVWWKTLDITDLDYTGMVGTNTFGGFVPPAGVVGVQTIPRRNQIDAFQFTEEIRFASSKDAPVQLGDKASLSWQSGALFFTQDNEQGVAFSFPAALGIPASDDQSDLNDIGIGAYGQGTVTLWDNLDLTAGVRVDFESKEADYRFNSTFSSLSDHFFSASPHGGLAYHFNPSHTVYGTITRGYRPGGFNNAEAGAAAATGAFDEEFSWDYEIGYKASFFEDRFKMRAAGFFIDWNDLQSAGFTPIGGVFVSNTDAKSQGVELELNARPVQWLDLFAGAGYVDAEYDDGATDGAGNAIGGRRLQYTPDYTINAGAQVHFPVAETLQVYARAEIIAYGDFAYEPRNLQEQEAYNLANFRAGVRGKHWFAEGWIRNAFDTEYIPQALAYSPGFLTPAGSSGFVGESGAPLTFGLKIGANF